MEKKLPQVPETTKLGNSAAELLTSVLDTFSVVVPIPTEKDLGIDMRAELLKGTVPTGIHYNVQCKGKEECADDVDKITYQIRVATINYWNQQKEPTFLIVVDRTSQVFYWTYPYSQVEHRLEEIQMQDTVSIHVPKTNSFDYKTRQLPKEMMDILYKYHFDILEKIASLLSGVELDSEVKIKDPVFDRIIEMHAAVNKILNSIQIIEELSAKIGSKILVTIEAEISKYVDTIVRLDSMSEVKKYTRGKGIRDEEGFITGTTPRELIATVRTNLDVYTKDASRDNLERLINSVRTLAELNMHLSYFLREMLYEMNPYGDYESLVEEYGL